MTALSDLGAAIDTATAALADVKTAYTAYTASLAPAPAPPPPTPPSPPVAAPRPGNEVYQFTGADVLDDPHIQGPLVIVDWRSVNPSPGVWDWSTVQARLDKIVVAGRKYGLRIQHVSEDPATTPLTPDYVIALCADKGLPVKGLANYFSLHYAASRQSLAIAFFAFVKAQKVMPTWVEWGLGVDGESKVLSTKAGPISQSVLNALGYSDAAWLTLCTLEAAEVAALTPAGLPLVFNVDASFVGGTAGYDEARMAGALRKYGWLGDHGYRQGAALEAWFASAPSVLEQYESTDKTGHDADTELTDMIANSIKAGGLVLLYGSDIPKAQTALAAHAAVI